MTVNLVAVILLLLAELSMFVPPSSTIVLAVLGVCFEILVVLNALFSVSWLFSRRKSWCLVSFIALLTVLPAIRNTWSIPNHSNGSSKPISLSILSYNTRLLQLNTPIERNELLKYVKNSGADVVCMQEYAVYKDSRYPTFEGVKRFLKDVYPYTYYDFVVHNRRVQFGLAVYSKYPLINKHSISFEAVGNSASRCDVLVPVEAGFDTVRLFNVHLQSNSFQSSDLDSLIGQSSLLLQQPSSIIHQPSYLKLRKAYAARSEQVRVLRNEVEPSPYPLILCGDFNDVPVSYTYRQLSHNLQDAFLEASAFSNGHTLVRRKFGVRIDYILSSPDFQVTDFRVEHLDYSDHYPVIATLHLRD